MNKEEIQEVVVEGDTNPTTDIEEAAEIRGGFSEEQLDQLKPMFPFLEKEYEKFEYGDLHVYCGHCGSDTAMLHPGMRNLQTSFVTQTNIDNHSIWSLACGVCGARLALHVKKAVNPPKNEKPSEENKEQTEETK